jgi:hypothetical protein
VRFNELLNYVFVGAVSARLHLCSEKIPALSFDDRTMAPAHLVLIKSVNQSKKNPKKDSFYFGAPGWIRTSDLELRSLLLYPAELPGHIPIIPKFLR